MERSTIDKACIVACEVARKAGDFHKNIIVQELAIKRKQGLDIVTEADLQAERLLVERVKLVFPDHAFSGEEFGSSGGDEELASVWRWVIDPLDGTINYANGIPWYSVSLALQYRGDTVLGVIYDVARDTMYTAKKGQGAFKNELPIGVSQEKSLSNSIVTFMLTSHYSQSETDDILAIVKRLASRTRGLRLWVGQALELASIAEGTLEGTICIKSRGFSAAAGVLLIREAGGLVSDRDGQTFGNVSRSIIATNGLVHEELLGFVKK